jgi:mannitol-1-phosphate 5-dehydrogenase
MKKFIMYGAGNIGRGFIGQSFSLAGYKVGFVDINMAVIDKLNADKCYPVNVVSNDGNTEIMVENVYGINGSDIELVSNEIASCTLMATAIGVNVLKFIAKPIALGIEKRSKLTDKPLNIIICENLIGADEYLKGLILKEIPHLKDYVETNVGFIEASIGRMVPVVTEEQKKDNFLRVFVEPYNILPVDKNAFKGEIITDVSNLYPFAPFNMFIERKLFMHNMSHALLSYLGYLRKYDYLYEATNDYDLRYVAFKALTASATAISKENGVDINMLLEHADNLLFRFTNVALGDTIKRVGKDTKRKLSSNDRLIGAIKLCEKHGVYAGYLCIGVAAGLCFNPSEDDGSAYIYDYVNNNGVENTLKDCSDYQGKYVGLIKTIYEFLKENKTVDEIVKYIDSLNGKEIKV